MKQATWGSSQIPTIAMLVEDQAGSGREQQKHQLLEPEYRPTRKDRRRDVHPHPGQLQYRPQIGQGFSGFISDYFRDFRPGLIVCLFDFRTEHSNPAGTYDLSILESFEDFQ